MKRQQLEDFGGRLLTNLATVCYSYIIIWVTTLYPGSINLLPTIQAGTLN